MVQPTPPQSTHPALFNLGFRPFFSGASIFAAITMAYWLNIYLGGRPLNIVGLSPFQWHAHEMIYGYSLAVIAGFLLTAVKNWTGQHMPQGATLVGIFSLWLAARVTLLVDAISIEIAAFFDLAFILTLIVAIARPIIITKQWRQLAILSKLVLLGSGNLLFYLGAMGYSESGIHLAIYGGLYLVIGLILTIGRRVIPFFVERGVGYPVQLYNSRWIDVSSLLFFLTFFVSELFLQLPWLSRLAAGAMFVITTARIIGWYTPGIWKIPLLWSLYIALGFIDLGFILFATQQWTSISPYLAIHAFAVGGIGVITMGMMARVSIGHTGRDLHSLPWLVPYCFALLVLGAVFRVLLPAIFEQHYALWIALSGGCWILGFTLFAFAILPILSRQRPDKTYG